jgi:hypothetical protein
VGYDVSCVIPRWGRTFANALRRIAPLVEETAEVERVVSIVTRGKAEAAASPEEAWRRLRAEECPYLSIAPDRKRSERLYRPGFLGMDLTVHGIRLRVEGDEPHNGSSLIKLDEVDFTIVGLDELLALNHRSLTDPRRVTKWGLYNYQLDRAADLRIAGSANLTAHNTVVGREITDFVGFFLISGSEAEGFRPDWEHIVTHRMPVYVKGRYKELVESVLPGLNTVPVSNVEDAVLGRRAAVGVEIVQSGSTVRGRGLRVFGRPLFLSESLFVANYRRYMSNPELRKLLELLEPLGYFDTRRIDHYADWFIALERNLGDSWIHRPEPDSLFCSMGEMRSGLRPYRLKTRRWMASDRYKREEAELLVARSLERIRRMYHEKSGS